MAKSPAHRFGQEIGNLLEEIIEPILREFCKKHKLYLDVKGSRGDARTGKKVTWEDKFGNVHDLDFVIEKDGTHDKKGRPVAFIEAAWRRYTKHSRNKAQEIQGAILPIAEKHKWDKPFLGSVIAGIFTDNFIKQMESVGFTVLYIPYETIVEAFKLLGVDVKFDEETQDKVFRKCVRQIEKLPKYKMKQVKENLTTSNKKVINAFKKRLSETLDRLIDQIIVVPLYGDQNRFSSILKAIKFISNHKLSNNHGEFRKYEIIVRYTNGDTISASFASKTKAISFLEYLKA